MIRNSLLRTLTRISLVGLFPFSAADKIYNWKQAIKQARSGPAPFAQAALELLLAGIAVEAVTPFCIVTGRRIGPAEPRRPADDRIATGRLV